MRLGHFTSESYNDVKELAKKSALYVQSCYVANLIKAMFTHYRIAFAPARKPNQIGLLFTQKNGDLGVVSVMERSCSGPIAKVESHIWDRCSYYN